MQKRGATLFDAIKKAIRYCESHELMADYFQKHESEVLDMVNFEWNADRAKEVAREEGRVEGNIETAKKMTNQFVLSLLKNKAPMKLITESTQLSVEEVEKIAKENKLAI